MEPCGKPILKARSCKDFPSQNKKKTKKRREMNKHSQKPDQKFHKT